MTPRIAIRRVANDTDEAPCVSVVVSTRNHARYLADLFDGIERQTFGSAELILVDNASTDETPMLASTFVEQTTRPVTYLRLDRDFGPAVGRSVGLDVARGEFVAFTDSDCVPSPEWLSRALGSFARQSVGIVQGRTECLESQAPLFSHFIETRQFDGSFSTSNVVYRRSAVGPHRFDPRCPYWEDTDFGFRVRADGWEVVFAQDALVRHQVVPQSPARWLLWPRRYANWPAKAARYPEFRRTLFLRLWVDPMLACFDLALTGVALAAFGRRRMGVMLVIPYLIGFGRARGLRGRAPVAKAGLHVVRDGVALAALVAGSIRNRSVVL